mmetsp:Transcript_22669/g.41013  ORF Transcript_22669/g.41013 Transcript_22669/m.41013 type:complete len:90 (+) Transcript_22669:99-368(+)
MQQLEEEVEYALHQVEDSLLPTLAATVIGSEGVVAPKQKQMSDMATEQASLTSVVYSIPYCHCCKVKGCSDMPCCSSRRTCTCSTSTPS